MKCPTCGNEEYEILKSKGKKVKGSLCHSDPVENVFFSIT